MNKKGFAPLIIIVIVTVVIGAGVGGFFILREKKMPSFENEKMVRQKVSSEDTTHLIEPIPSPVQFTQPSIPKTQLELKLKSTPSSPVQVTTLRTAPVPPPSYSLSPSGWLPPKDCKGTTIKFSVSPVDPNSITHIVPLGKMAASHVTPTDHGYIHTAYPGIVPEKLDDVRAPADGYITDIQAFPSPNDYRMILWHSCTISTIFIHLVELAPEIKALSGDLPPGSNLSRSGRSPIPVKAGQVIAKMRGGVDFSIHDTAVTLRGFVIPSHYYDEAWKIHTVDLFDYFVDSIRSELRGKSMRIAEPRGGKIDYDIDGRLIGNWFVENTGGYRGGGVAANYWNTHLAFAYHHINPTQIMISVPNSGINDQEKCNVCFGLYGVKGNAPDPKDITSTTGLVKYELVARFYSGADPRDDIGTYKNLDNEVLGVFWCKCWEIDVSKQKFSRGKLLAKFLNLLVWHESMGDSFA